METNNQERYIGLVKWFGDKARKINYGFIFHPVGGDYYFHENDVSNDSKINKITENKVVVFSLEKSRKPNGGLEAKNITLIEDLTDLNFLFTQFIEVISLNGMYSENKILVDAIYKNTKSKFSIIKDFPLKKILFIKFNDFIKDKLKEESYQNIKLLNTLSLFCRSAFIEFVEEFEKTLTQNLNIEKSHELWIKGIISKANINYISELFFRYNEIEKKSLISKLSENELINLGYKFIQDIDENTIAIEEVNILAVYTFINSSFSEKKEDLLVKFLNICPPYIKLTLWIKGDLDILDFTEYKPFVITLSSEDQIKFVKKTLKYIHEGKANISIDDFTSINLIDFDTSKQIEAFDSLNKLDYSTSIVLNTISELNKKIDLNGRRQISDVKNKIYNIILNQIKSPEDILEIRGYFDFCEGRCNAYRPSFIDSEGKTSYGEIKKNRNPEKKSELHLICDGRKAMNNQIPAIDENTELEYWWCANQKCFEPSRKLHSSLEWEKYTLLDFLTILKVPFDEKGYEIYLNIINKANRYLKHLKCRECNQILRPKGKSNYAFYGVTDFNCVNTNCNKIHERIYLTHCLNGMCDQLIDSRDSVKCKPEGFNEDCGWYVCNYCHSCCSNEVIQRRVYILNQTGQEYKCHTQGHRNLGILSCNKCGHAMNEVKFDSIQYNKNLEWLLNNINEPNTIISNHGTNRYGKKWFILRQNSASTEEFYSLLEKLKQSGFNIPDINQQKTSQLVSEPMQFGNLTKTKFECVNCDNKFDLAQDSEKATVIKYFHKNVFF